VQRKYGEVSGPKKETPRHAKHQLSDPFAVLLLLLCWLSSLRFASSWSVNTDEKRPSRASVRSLLVICWTGAF